MLIKLVWFILVPRQLTSGVAPCAELHPDTRKKMANPGMVTPLALMVGQIAADEPVVLFEPSQPTPGDDSHTRLVRPKLKRAKLSDPAHGTSLIRKSSARNFAALAVVTATNALAPRPSVTN